MAARSRLIPQGMSVLCPQIMAQGCVHESRTHAHWRRVCVAPLHGCAGEPCRYVHEPSWIWGLALISTPKGLMDIVVEMLRVGPRLIDTPNSSHDPREGLEGGAAESRGFAPCHARVTLGHARVTLPVFDAPSEAG
jgi:hypothetical protein